MRTHVAGGLRKASQARPEARGLDGEASEDFNWTQQIQKSNRELFRGHGSHGYGGTGRHVIGPHKAAHTRLSGLGSEAPCSRSRNEAAGDELTVVSRTCTALCCRSS